MRDVWLMLCHTYTFLLLSLPNEPLRTKQTSNAVSKSAHTKATMLVVEVALIKPNPDDLISENDMNDM